MAAGSGDRCVLAMSQTLHGPAPYMTSGRIPADIRRTEGIDVLNEIRRRPPARSTTRKWRSATAGAALLGVGSIFAFGTGSPAGANATSVYRQTNLVSDIPGVARKTDPNLINPWGMSEFPNGPLWVSDNGSNVATIYTGDRAGSPLMAQPLVVKISGGAPDGQVFNPTSQFVVKNGMSSGAAGFIFASENGDISAWAPNVPTQPPGMLSHQAFKVFSDPNAVYKGLTIETSGLVPLLYAANFRAGTIDVFDGNFHKVADPDGSSIPAFLRTTHRSTSPTSMGSCMSPMPSKTRPSMTTSPGRGMGSSTCTRLTAFCLSAWSPGVI